MNQRQEVRELKRIEELNELKDGRKRKRIFGKDITNMSHQDSIKTNETEPKKKMISNQVKEPSEQNKQPLKKDPLEDHQLDVLDFMISKSKCASKSREQPYITDKMRLILIDWLIDVHESFQLKEQTLHLALHFLAEFEAKFLLLKEEYQLVGITCLWIASKYEQIYPPRMKKFVGVTANAYSSKDFLKMEEKIMENLKFQLTHITSLKILEGIIDIQDDKKFYHFCCYLQEFALFYGFNKQYTPTALALTTISLTELILKKKVSKRAQKETSQTPQIKMSCFKELCCKLQQYNSTKLTSIRRKFAKEKYHFVGQISIKATQ